MLSTRSQTWKRHCAAFIVALTVPVIASCSGQPQNAAGLLPAQPARVAGVHYNAYEYDYQTLDAPADPTTQLWGIDDYGKIVGSYGDGSASNPYNGITVYPPYAAKNFQKHDYPNATNTVLTSVNNSRAVDGWYETTKNWIFGCTLWKGFWQSYKEIKLRGSKTEEYTKILGVNDSDLGVGYYVDASGTEYAFEVNEVIDRYVSVKVPNATNAVATSINNKGDIAGYATLTSGSTVGWLFKGTHFTEFTYPAATSTQAWGVAWDDEIVGQYTDSSGATHGFTLFDPLSSQEWQSIDEPNAAGYTVLTSVNDHKTITGFYKDSSGAVNGLLATFKGSGSGG